MSLTRFAGLTCCVLMSATMFGCSSGESEQEQGADPVGQVETPEVTPEVEEPVVEPKQDDDPEAITKIEDMYGEAYKDDDGFVTTVDFGGAFGEKVDLSVLKGVPNTEKLVLNGADVSDEDLVHLKELKSLKSLDLGETRVSDAGMEMLL